MTMTNKTQHLETSLKIYRLSREHTHIVHQPLHQLLITVLTSRHRLSTLVENDAR